MFSLPRLVLGGLILACACAAVYFFNGSSSRKTPAYTFAALSRGSIETTISSSGTLSPVTQVEVGTQVSGTIARICVDFNDHVMKGQILAVVDTSVLMLAVTDAESQYMRAEASLEEAVASAARSSELYKKGMLSSSEFQTVKTTLKTAQASITSAGSALERAKQNLRYAIIKSPIDGTVTLRSIEVGQTVAASFSTPTLFIIAQDLSKMEIKALVDESDIGLIKVGQEVRFSVQAYPKRKFFGTVKQVRVQPSTSSNVVNYTVLISAANDDMLLLPGMTATVNFVVNKKEDVLRVPNTALRFTPGEAELAALFPQRPDTRPGPPHGDSSSHRMGPPEGGMPPPGAMMPPSGDRKRLFYLNANNVLAMEPVITGITDGTYTELVECGSLVSGMKVISGSDQPSQTTATKSAAKMPTGGPPGGMPPPM